MEFMRNAYLCIVNMTIRRVNADYFPLLEHEMLLNHDA